MRRTKTGVNFYDRIDLSLAGTWISNENVESSNYELGFYVKKSIETIEVRKKIEKSDFGLN